MKQFFLLLTLLISISFNSTLNAQVCLTTTLATQTDVNNFICTSVDGDLIVEDDNDGIDDIVDLDPIYVNGMQPINNSSVSGNVIVRNCNNLPSFRGLDGIVEIGGDLQIINNDALLDRFGSSIVTIGGNYIVEDNQNYQRMEPMASLISIGGNFNVQRNPAMYHFATCSALTMIGGDLNIDDIDGMTDFISLTAVTSVGGLVDIARNSMLVNFAGLQNLQTTGGWISFYDNSVLTTINTFDQVTTIGSNLLIQLCPALVSLPHFTSLQSVSDVLIRGTSISSLDGFAGITTSTGSIRINSNLNLTSFTAFGNLQTSGFITIENCGLNILDAFNSLQSSDSYIRIIDNPSLTEISGFSQLTTIGGELGIRYNNAMTTISAFGNLTTASDRIDIAFNDVLTSITEFPSLASVGNDFKLYKNSILPSYTGANNLVSIGNDIWIHQNFSLTDINAFASLTSLTNNLVVQQNWNLADCCTFLPVIAIAGGTSNISGNAPGCNSTAEIGMAVPMISCPVDFTVGSTTGLCAGDVTMTDPSPTDDCGVTTYTLNLINGDGATVYNNATAIPGLVETLSLPVGFNTYTYTATDFNGQTSSCQTIAEVIDTEAPVWDDIDGMTTVFGQCGIDNPLDLFNANIPSATDNCITLSVSAIGFSTTAGCGSSFTETHTFQSVDANNNVSLDYILTIVIEDTANPTISALPADVTIFCDDAFPPIPTPTAFDQCAGDISSSIVVTPTVTAGNCTVNTPAETHTYTYSVDDGCGNTDEAHWVVTVMNDYEFTLGPDIAVCDVNNATITAPSVAGTYLWSTTETTQSINVTSSAIYSVTITTNNGCCNSDAVAVIFGTAPSATAEGGELDCSGTPIQIIGNSSTTGVTYAWTGPGGFTSDLQAPFVSEAGTYDLTVTDPNGCTQTAAADVTANTNVPPATASGGTVTCDVTTVQLMSESTEPGVIYSWTGPNGFTSNMQNPMATDPGIYTVSVLATNGCIGTASTEILDDTAAPTIAVSANAINCTITSTILMTDASANVITYAWTGPNGFTSDIAEPIANEVGTYNLTVTATNGCTTGVWVEVVGDFTVPDASASGGTLSCSSSQIQINGGSSTANVVFGWTGPNGFTSGLQNPSVTQVGTYILTVTGQNGCTSTSEAEVLADSDLPSAVAMGGVIDCINNEVMLMGSSDNPDVSFDWTGPAGYASEEQNPTVTNAGTYQLIVSAPNGCTAMQTTTVSLDTSSSQVLVNLASVNCDLANVSLGSTTNTPDGTYLWSGPNGFSSSSPNPMIDVAGTYTLTITPANGCAGSASVTIEGPFGAPDISATGGLLGCTDLNVQLTGESSTEDASYLWTGPGNFSSISQNPFVNEVGTYTLKVTSPNGCTAIQSVSVTGDNDLPQITAIGGKLNCDVKTVTLQGSSSTPNTTLSWTGPNGFISDEASPTISVPGVYVLTVTSENDCSISASVTIEQDNATPFIVLKKGSVDCDAGQMLFIAETNAINSLYSWSGPNGFTSDQLIAEVSDAGSYTFTVFPPNGCDTDETQELEFDISYTSEIMTVDATETVGGMATIEIVGGTGAFNILWDNGDTGTMADDLVEGMHTVTVIDGLACSKVYDFEIKKIIAVFEEELSSSIVLYPAPATSVVTLAIQDIHRDINSISIYDMRGNLVNFIPWKTSQSLIKKIDVSQYTAGMYLLKLNKEGGYYLKKLMVE